VAEAGLGLWTCGAWLGLAVVEKTGLLRSAQWLEGRQMSEQLLPRLAEFLEPLTVQDVSWIAVAAGPGSFTSLRLGVVVARTLGQGLQIPIFTESALACAVLDQITPRAVSMAAHGGQIYGAVLRGRERMSAENIYRPEAWDLVAADYPRVHLDDLPTQNLVEKLVYWAGTEYRRGERPSWEQAIPIYVQPFPVTQ